MAKTNKGLGVFNTIVTNGVMNVDGEIQIGYSWTVGKGGEHFLTELRDNKKMTGTRCRQCGRVFVPPRVYCEECYADDVDWVDVEPKGTLITFGDSYIGADGKTLDKPWILGVVRINGSEGGFLHYIGEAATKDLKIGMPMEAVFKDEREGSILDIEYFRPVKD